MHVNAEPLRAHCPVLAEVHEPGVGTPWDSVMEVDVVQDVVLDQAIIKPEEGVTLVRLSDRGNLGVRGCC